MAKAIETRYKGYRFRSRLEARWAVYFDALGCDWEYEPEGFDLGDGVLYLPDFRVGWKSGEEATMYWAEVKPTDLTNDETEKANRFVDQVGDLILLVGLPSAVSYPHLCRYEDGRIDSDIVLAEHKGRGRFFLGTGNAPLTPLDRHELSWWDDLPRAVKAARGARFEHGERG